MRQYPWIDVYHFFLKSNNKTGHIRNNNTDVKYRNISFFVFFFFVSLRSLQFVLKFCHWHLIEWIFFLSLLINYYSLIAGWNKKWQIICSSDFFLWLFIAWLIIFETINHAVYLANFIIFVCSPSHSFFFGLLIFFLHSWSCDDVIW